jgi:hypothetical protein
MAAFAACVLATRTAAADAPDPAHPLGYEMGLRAAMNPGSLYFQTGLRYRRAL